MPYEHLHNYLHPDPRVCQPLVEQGVVLFRQITTARHGRIVFLAGEASLGGSATLHTLADRLLQQFPKPFVIGGQFAQGRYTPWSAVKNGAIIDLVGNVVALLGVGLAASPLLASLAGFLGQLLQASAAHAVTQEFYQKQQRNAVDVLDPLVIFRPLRRAALDRPVVCVLEQFGQAEGRTPGCAPVGAALRERWQPKTQPRFQTRAAPHRSICEGEDKVVLTGATHAGRTQPVGQTRAASHRSACEGKDKVVLTGATHAGFIAPTAPESPRSSGDPETHQTQ